MVFFKFSIKNIYKKNELFDFTKFVQYKIVLERPIISINCTANEDQIIQHCSAPLNNIHSRLDQLFEGGLQSFLKNVNNLAPVFAEGCKY